jgi:3',5'-cyclic AMP phosphodiesterase CpdA
MKKVWKSALSLELCAALLLCAVFIANAGSAGQTLRVLVASDIHYRPPEALAPIEQASGLAADPVYGHANDKGMLTYEADAVIGEFLAQAAGSGAQYLLIPGDLSEEGYWEEHLGIAKKLREFESGTGIQVFVIPGNHDIRTSASRGRLDLSDFLEIYADLGYDRALARFEGDGSYTAELGGGYRLLAIDAIVYREDESRISPELFAWIEAQALAARKDGKNLVAMTHYNVLDHFLIEGFTSGLLCIDQHRTLASALADLGVKYVFTGHQHANDIAHAVTAKGNKLFDIETGSLITYPNAWREVAFTQESVRIETKYVEKIDAALLPEGFSEAQLRLMQSDFPAYSRNYWRASFRSHYTMIPSLTGTVAQALSLEEGGAGYKAVEAAVLALEAAANLPLYGAGNSVEALAKRAGVTLSPSGYVNLLDLAGTVYGEHMAGNERLPMESLEMRLLGQALNAVLVTALADMPTQAANALFAAAGMPWLKLPPLDGLRTLAAKRIYMRTPAKAFTNELVRMVGQGILTDWSAPDDLNATLEPYGGSHALEGNAAKITDASFVLDIVLRFFGVVLSVIHRLSPLSPR